ncbi:DNA primase [Pseudomonas neustonica]|uniref:DNA primase n=1 Tax=Pseudomonas neustonica TaxID=2487346 RepID=A0ABX9XKJ4_9PSED|nr:MULTISPECIES: DNA primase [Pseudomonas]MBA6418477.1 DNA primase [Pseudomonas sp. 5Ae-yellow]ROZ85742.1 DNA primase [Pseudomonas sp. SSM44]ROZ87366.1 DNA primase [Pseudomonas neustonica]|tara:strand:- start:1311 stop:3221 length:1911 start_codon:yes stop_codon:yes gene_type:complete
MAGLIPQGFIDDLLGRTDIVEVVGARLKLKKTGKNYSALCPFHNEKSPSFSVSPDKQFYYCFGCGAGGNALSFVMDFERLDFPEAVEDLAKQAGVAVPREERSDRKQQNTPRKDSPLYALLEQAAAYYRQQLRHHPKKQRAVSYLKQRGLTGHIAKTYDLGLAPPGWDNLMSHLSRDTSEQKALIEAGLVVENEDSGKRYDRFRDRIMFPIRDSRGRVIGFGGRVLGDDKPKYLNSPETPVFHKGQELYGLYEAKQQNRQLDDVIVVEGYMDVIALAQHGVTNAVATLGTATSEDHLKRLFRLVHSVTFCFDGDKAGKQAAWRALNSALPVLEDGRHVRFLFLPDGQDPDSMVREEGQQAFQQRVNEQAEPLTEYLFRHLSIEANPVSLEGKAHLAALALPLIDKVPGSLLRRLLRQSLAQITGMDLNRVETEAKQPVASLSEPATIAAPEQQDAPPNWDDDWQPPMDDYAPSYEPSERNERPAPRKPQRSGKKGVDSPLLQATRTLLHHPHLAGMAQQANELADEDKDEARLLVALLDAAQKNPGLSTIELLARWHGTALGEQLSHLAEQEWLLNNPDHNLEQQFFDTINRLSAEQTERHIDKLLAKSANQPLSAEEKQQLLDLFGRQRAPKTDS